MWRTAGNDSVSPIKKSATNFIALSGEGDVVIGAQQPQAHRDVGCAIVPDLFKRGVEETVEINPRHDNPQHMRRSKEVRRRRSAIYPSDQDTTQLIDAADRGARIVNRGRHGPKRDIDNLDDPKLDVLLHCPRWADVKSCKEVGRPLGRNTLDLGNSKKGNARGDEMTDPTFHPNANAIASCQLKKAIDIDVANIAGPQLPTPLATGFNL
jgi:hypothetical protein